MEQQEGSCSTPGSKLGTGDCTGSLSPVVFTDTNKVESSSLVVPAELSSVRLLRRHAVDFASRCPFSEECLADIELAVGEACSNAIRHGSPRDGLDFVTLRCTRTDSAVLFEISDSGPGFDPHITRELPVENLDQGNLGIFVMRKLMDSVEFRFNGGTTVRLLKRCKMPG